MNEQAEKILAVSGSALKMVGDTASKALNVSKAYANRAKEEMELRRKFYELGKICYEMYSSGSDETGNIKTKIEEIKKAESRIDITKEHTGASRRCPVCGAANIYSNSFCSKCGSNL